MACLEEIAATANILKTGPASTVQLLHKIVNDEPYRLNCAGSVKELSERIFKNLSDLASLKNNFTEQLTDDEDGDSAPFSLESTNDANKQPLSPQPLPITALSTGGFCSPPSNTTKSKPKRERRESIFVKGPFFNYEVVYGK
ncbi:hypothetical protein TNCV_1957141 [Trichonephila clavipes]|nr:hypothetical protein TNCV_1957141 [Trichonephila clavipes]